jgi:hypothetical protein
MSISKINWRSPLAPLARHFICQNPTTGVQWIDIIPVENQLRSSMARHYKPDKATHEVQWLDTMPVTNQLKSLLARLYICQNLIKEFNGSTIVYCDFLLIILLIVGVLIDNKAFVCLFVCLFVHKPAKTTQEVQWLDTMPVTNQLRGQLARLYVCQNLIKESNGSTL